jgi:hypothetical protein
VKKVFLMSIAALFLATGTAHAAENECKVGDKNCLCDNEETGNGCRWASPNFVADCRRDRIIVHVDEKAKGDWPKGWELPGVQIVPPRDGERRFVIINDVDKAARTRLEKMLREWRKCDAYYQCLADRDAGKVKHCYANDKRWRDVYSGEL